MKLRSSALEAAFGIPLPDRYRRFVESAEYVDHNGRVLRELRGHSSPRGFPLRFDAPDLQRIFAASGVDIAIEQRIPIAVPGHTRGCVLTIDASTADGPIEIWEDGLFLRFLPNLDALLDQLTGSPITVVSDDEDDEDDEDDA